MHNLDKCEVRGRSSNGLVLQMSEILITVRLICFSLNFYCIFLWLGTTGGANGGVSGYQAAPRKFVIVDSYIVIR